MAANRVGRRALAATAVVTAVLLTLVQVNTLDGLPGVLGWMIDSTVYSQDYTDNGFITVQQGMTDEDVERLLGRPLGQFWDYTTVGCGYISFTWNGVFVETPQTCKLPSLPRAAASRDILGLWGKPPTMVWTYTRNAGGPHFRERVVYFASGHVINKEAYFYFQKPFTIRVSILKPQDPTDVACMNHGLCYAAGGFTPGSHFEGHNAQLTACNTQLCNAVRARLKANRPQPANEKGWIRRLKERDADAAILIYFNSLLFPGGGLRVVEDADS